MSAWLFLGPHHAWWGGVRTVTIDYYTALHMHLRTHNVALVT